MRRIVRFLLSPVTVILLITALAAACVLATVIPQTAQDPGCFAPWEPRPLHHLIFDLLGLNRVYTSGWFFSLIVVAAVSLVCSLYYQTMAALKHPAPGMEHLRPGQGAERFGAKDRRCRWGGVVFHLGLLCIILAGLAQAAFHQRGFVSLSEGDLFDGRAESWESAELGLLAHPFELGFQPRLKSFTSSYQENGALAAVRSELAVSDPTGRTITLPLAVNQPGRFRGIKIFQSGDYGYTLSLILNEKSEAPIFVRLLLREPQPGKPAFRSIRIPTTSYELDLEFFPDLHGSRGLGAPVADLTVSENGALPLSGRLSPGDTALLHHGDTLTLRRISCWTGLIFVKNFGVPLLCSGFAITLLGAFMIYGKLGDLA